MNLKLSFCGALCALLSLAVSCDKDDKAPAAAESKAYSGLNALDLTFNGSGMAGKRVSVYASESVSLTVDGIFDISSLSDSFKGLAPLPAPGAIPGSPTLTIPVTLKAKDGKWSFSGKGETAEATYSYSGSFTPEKMTMAFSDVKLKDQSLANSIWAPAPVKKGDGLFTYLSQPFLIEWDLELPLPIPGLENGLGEILDMLVNLPFIPVYHDTAVMSLTQVISNGLRTVAFNPDGNIVVVYLQTANGSSIFTHAPLSTFQYVPAGADMARLYVNPTDILTLVLLNNTNKGPDIPEHPFGKASRADGNDTPAISPETMATLMQALYSLAAQCAAGVPVHLDKTSEGNLQFYVGADVILPFMTNYILPILSDPAIQQMLAAYIASQPALAPHAGEIQVLLDALPLLLAQTTDIRFGLNLVPYAN